MLCVLMIVFLFIVRLTLSSIIMSLTLSLLLWALCSLHYYETYALFVIMSLTLFVIMSLTLSLLLCVCALCFTIQTLYSYSLQIVLSSNTINQSTWNFHHFSLHNLYPNYSTYSDTLNQFKTFHSYMLTYRRFSRKSSIICISIKYEKYLFSVSRILTLAASDSWLEHPTGF
jgi:hypothetical protein